MKSPGVSLRPREANAPLLAKATIEFEGHKPYFTLLLEELWYASPEFRFLPVHPFLVAEFLADDLFVASGLVPDGFSHRVVASNPRVFSLLATHKAVRSMVE